MDISIGLSCNLYQENPKRLQTDAGLGITPDYIEDWRNIAFTIDTENKLIINSTYNKTTIAYEEITRKDGYVIAIEYEYPLKFKACILEEKMEVKNAE